MPMVVLVKLAIPELHIRESLLGSKHELVLEGKQAALLFPERESEPQRGADFLHIPASRVTHKVAGESVWTIRELTVFVVMPGEITAKQHSQSLKVVDDGTSDALHATADRANQAARQLVERLLQHARATYGQFLIGPVREQTIETITLMVGPDGVNFPFSIQRRAPRPEDGLKPLGAGSVDELLSLSEQPIEPYDTLMADALYYLHSSANPRLAVVLAAISAELRIKAFLTDSASPEQAALMKLLVKSRMPVLELYTKGLEAVIGSSLSKDDPKLYETLRRLFVERNGFVHSGGREELTVRDAEELVNAARDASSYLNGLALEFTIEL